jgi:CCR4-NOT transcription complex subunit 1
VCANDNLELGCILIEKASTEKAIRNVDVEETFTTAIQSRRKCRETGQPFVDQVAAAAVSSTSKYPQELSDALKPRAGGLHPQQLLVYEAFQRARTVPQAPSTQAGGDSQQAAPNQSPDMKMQQLNAQAQSQPGVVALSMSQALEGYSLVLNRLDMALKTVHIQAQGRDISISMLGGEHEILTYLRDLIIITQRIQPVVRTETAMTFCENVFKRLMDSISVADTLRLEVMIGTIEAIRDACGGIKKFAPDIVSWLGHYASFNLNDETAPKVHRAILLLLLRAKLIRTEVLDVYFATYMDGGRNIVWVELALMFIRQCLSEGLAATYEFANTFDTVSKMHPANPQVKKQLQKWLTELRALAKHAEEQKIANNPTATALGDQRVREHVTGLLEQWLRVWQSINDQVFSSYLQLMHQYGVLNTEEAADKFFRVATELCVEACLKSAVPSGVPSADGGMSNTTLTFSVIDALSKLFLLLVRLADKEAADVTVRVNLLTRILNAVARTLLEDHDAKKAAKAPFDQRPYFRLFSNLSQDLGVPDSKAEPNPVVLPLLQTYCHVYLALQPSVLPGFAFSWLQLISHRTFMPQLLLVKGQKCWPYMHRLMIALLLFLQPFLKQAALNDSIRKLYKGTLRVFLVLLHDFPEFLCDFHLSLCDIIPSTCVQLRNLVLSAFPRSMRLPDPFTPNLKVDLLQEISQAPRILTDYMGPLGERGVRQRLDSYITSKQPADLPSMLPSLIVSTNAAGGVAFNVPLLTSIVVYVGAQTIVQLQSKMPLQNSPSLDIFKQLVAAFDAEGRYHLFNAMANQLRYPNSHTHYFSCILLLLFADAENEAVQEQITRVLLERLIVHRPHPVRYISYVYT